MTRRWDPWRTLGALLMVASAAIVVGGLVLLVWALPLGWRP